jgi:hypothetical protein
MFAAVGRLQEAAAVADAARPTDQKDVAGAMAVAIARAALYEAGGDLPGLREFASRRWHDPLPATERPFLARRAPFSIEAGLLNAAERDLEWFKRRTAQRAEWTPGAPARQFQPFYASNRAAIALKRGRAAEAVAILRQQMPVLRSGPQWLFGQGGWQTQYAALKLAEGLEVLGKPSEAIAALEDAVKDRVAMTIGNTPDRWLLANAQLARLYRKVGEEAKARALEAKLLQLLARADPGHPLAAALQRPRDKSR